MLDDKELQSGHWLRSTKDFIDISLPVTVAPGESITGICKCVLNPDETLDRSDLNNYVEKHRRDTIPLSIRASCDDTYGGKSVTEYPIGITFAPLKDKLKAHWARSEYM